jgi:L-lactate dehydrogenase complex protein LldF
VDNTKKQGMKLMASVLSNPKLFRFSGKAGRTMMRLVPFSVSNPLNPWYKQREMPEPPKESFREWYVKKMNN